MIVKTRTTVDVLWQDGTKSEGVRGADLFPVEDLGEAPMRCLLFYRIENAVSYCSRNKWWHSSVWRCI
jgi:hypothetical protein